MAEVWFEPRYRLSRCRDPDPTWLRDTIQNAFAPDMEFGEASLTYRGSGSARLIVITDETLGYYLKYISKGDEWLSLGNIDRLSEVVCPDDWEASAGLFVSFDQAWSAISEFCRSGQRSEEIAWIRPSDIPENGNW